MLQGFSELVARIRTEYPALWYATGIWIWICFFYLLFRHLVWQQLGLGH